MNFVADSLHGVVDFFARLFVLRYALFLLFVPTSLAAAASLNREIFWIFAELRQSNELSDIAWMMAASMFVVLVGLVILHYLLRHADERFRNGQPPVAPTKAGWQVSTYIVWFVCSLPLPLTAILLNGTAGQLFIGLILGALIAVGIALLIAVLQQLALGRCAGATTSGLFPFESLFQQMPGVPGLTWLFGTPGKGCSSWFNGKGYTDSAGLLYPGQAQLLLFAIISTVAYIATLYLGIHHGWGLDWPVAFYALVLAVMVGWFFAGLAFYLDYYRIPALVVTIVVVLCLYSLHGFDHFFEVNGRRAEGYPFAPHPPELPAGPDGVNPGKNVFLAAFNERQKDVVPEPLYLAEVLSDWNLPPYEGKRTLVVVTASGGGIQAAAWTTKVLTELDDEYEGFSQSIGLVSGVSGGSVGSMYYLGHRGLRDSKLALAKHMMDAQCRQRIRDCAASSSMEPTAWGMAFPDFLPLPLPMNRLIDRGLALESSWWDRMSMPEHRSQMQQVTIRDLIPLIEERRMAPVIFNATCVETGQRAYVGPIRARAVRPHDEKNQKAKQREDAGQDLVALPIDFLPFYDLAVDGGQKVDVPVTTAVRLSATFSYVTPVSRPDWSAVKWKSDEKFGGRQHLHFCDGGYADNSGLETAVRLIAETLKHYKQQNKRPPFERVLFIRIEPFPPGRAQAAQDNRGFQAEYFGPLSALAATRTSTQAARAELELGLLQEAYPPPPDVAKVNAEVKAVRVAVAKVQKENKKAPPQKLPGVFQPNVKDRVASKGAMFDKPLVAAKDGKKKQPGEFHELLTLDDLKEATEIFAAWKNDPDVKDNKALKDANDALEALKTLQSTKPPGKSKGDWSVPVVSLTFRFRGNEEQPIPLSWRLSEAHRQAIDLAWKDRFNSWNETHHFSVDRSEGTEEAIFQLEKYFPKRKQPKAP